MENREVRDNIEVEVPQKSVNAVLQYISESFRDEFHRIIRAENNDNRFLLDNLIARSNILGEERLKFELAIITYDGSYYESDKSLNEFVKRYLAINSSSHQVLHYLYESSDNDFLKYKVLKNENCPEELLRRVFGLGEYKYLFHLAYNPNCPRDLVEKFAKMENVNLRSAAARNRAVSLETLISLAGDHNDYVRMAAAENESLPRKVLYSLISDYSKGVRKTVASQLNFSDSNHHFESLTWCNQVEVLAILLKNPACPLDLYQRFLERNDSQLILAALIQSPHCDEEFFMQNRLHYFNKVRAAAAGSERLPEEFFEDYIEDSDSSVRASIAANPNLTERMMYRLLRDRSMKVMQVLRVREDLPRYVLEFFQKSRDKQFKFRAALNKSLTEKEKIDFLLKI